MKRRPLTSSRPDSDDDEGTGLLDTGDVSGESSGGEEAQSDEELYASASGSDSDDAPEEVGFTAGRQAAIQKVKDTLQQIRSDKQSSKDRRKKHQELYAQQKAERLASLADSRLPEGLLEELGDEPETKKARVGGPGPEGGPGAEGGLSEEEEDSAGEDEDSEDADEEDYIPLNTPDCGVQAVTIPDFLKKTKTSQQSAADFRQSMLYGKHVRRQDVSALLGQKAKRKARLK